MSAASAVPGRLGTLAADPPLVPSPDDASEAVRRELARPEYYQDNLVLRLLAWIGRQLDGGVARARDTPPLTWFAITLVTVALVVGVALLLSRARRSASAARERADVLTDDVASAAQLRQRAELALAEGRFDEVVVEAFRALARRQVETGRLADDPGVTAREVARLIAAWLPGDGGLAVRAAAGADLFDAVRYGDRTPTREQALGVLGLDSELAELAEQAGAR